MLINARPVREYSVTKLPCNIIKISKQSKVNLGEKSFGQSKDQNIFKFRNFYPNSLSACRLDKSDLY
jgi:hypothetical protein